MEFFLDVSTFFIISAIIVLFVCLAGYLVAKTIHVKRGKELALGEIANARYN